MITVESLLYKLDVKLNKLSSLSNQSIPTENKILAIQEAEIKLVKQKLNPNNSLALGFDGNRKRYEDLEVLIESAHDHVIPLALVDEKLNKWSGSLKELVPDYMFHISSYLLADKGECKNKVVYVNPSLTKHTDVSILLQDSNNKPSFEWQETFCTLSSLNIEVYTDGTFTPNGLYISYIRYPKKTDYPGYIKLDGTDSLRQDSELPEYLEDEILNLAVIEIAMNTENTPAIQSGIEKSKSLE